MDYIKLCIEFLKIKIQSTLEYRAAFILQCIAQFLSYFVDAFLLWIMIKKFNTIGSWSAYEVMVLYGFNLCSYALAGFFFYSVNYNLSRMIRNGEFDELLIRPIDPLFYLACRRFNYGYIAHVAVSLVIMFFAFGKLGIKFTFVKVIMLILALIGAALIQSAMFLYTCIPSFWLVNANSLKSLIFTFKNFITYPISIYNKVIQFILTFVIPYAFVNFYPSQYFLGKNDGFIFHPIFNYLTPLVGLLLFMGALRFWKRGVKNYTSTGS